MRHEGVSRTVKVARHTSGDGAMRQQQVGPLPRTTVTETPG